MSKRNFLVRLGAMAIVALCVSAAAAQSERTVRTYASHSASSSNGVKITTDCGMSGYMVAVG